METKTEEEVERRVVGGKEVWGAEVTSNEAVESGAEWETKGEKNDLIIDWLEEVAGCFSSSCAASAWEGEERTWGSHEGQDSAEK